MPEMAESVQWKSPSSPTSRLSSDAASSGPNGRR
jgi:hypothetical protein